MKVKRRFIFGGLVIACGFLIFTIINRPVYGNNEEGIIDCISEDETFEKRDKIQIFDIVDFEDIKLVGYFYEEFICSAEFIRNKQGNYELHSRYWSQDNIQINNLMLNGRDYKRLVVVSSGKSDINKIKVKHLVDFNSFENESPEKRYEVIEKEIMLNKPTITVIDLNNIINDKDTAYSYVIEYFDKNGNRIE